MLNEVTFGSRIAVVWQTLVGHLNATTAEISAEKSLTSKSEDNAPKLEVLQKLGSELSFEIYHGFEEVEEVPWLITAAICSGIDNRDDIVALARRFTRFSGHDVDRHLRTIAGTDPKKHICFKDETGRYRLLLRPKPTSA